MRDTGAGHHGLRTHDHLAHHATFDPANQAWDGESRVIRGPTFTDLVPLTGGPVFLVGLPWTDDVASFAQMFVDHSATRNGCSQARDERDVTVAGAPAVVFTVDSCGSDDIAFARVAVVHDGFGLIAFVGAVPGREGEAVDHLLSSLTGLAWDPL